MTLSAPTGNFLEYSKADADHDARKRHRPSKHYGIRPHNPDPNTRYGLPQTVRVCRKCVISNQRPNSTPEFLHKSDSKKTVIALDEAGVCDACRVTEAKEAIDWEARDAELRELCDRHRRNDGHYDCIAPGSGGKDSFYASHILKYEYGMHPLTVTRAPHIYTEWGWRNFQKWIHSGFDNMLITPNGRVRRLLTRLAFENFSTRSSRLSWGKKSRSENVRPA
jgi:hypothetical protein